MEQGSRRARYSGELENYFDNKIVKNENGRIGFLSHRTGLSELSFIDILQDFHEFGTRNLKTFAAENSKRFYNIVISSNYSGIIA